MAAINISSEFFNHDAQAGGFFPDTHINKTFDVGRFVQERGKNYIIEGIRGTGKTHILKMIAEEYFNNFNRNRVLPIYFSLAQVSEWTGDKKLFRLQLYTQIVLKSVQVIEQYPQIKNAQNLQNSDVKSKSVEKLREMFYVKEQKNFDLLIREIHELSEKLISKLTFNPGEIDLRSSSTGNLDAEAKFNAGIASSKVQGNAEIAKEQQIELIGRTLSHENAAQFILEYFKEIKKILSLSFSLILLDEVSEMDADSQIEIFRLLKVIRSANDIDPQRNYMYFVAAVYPPQSTFYPSKENSGPFNFDPGHDATMEYLELDENLDEYEDFFKNLTEKRIEHIENKNHHKFDNYLSIFDEDKTFALAAYAANGIPRRYLELLKQAYENLQQRTASLSDSSDILKMTSRDIEQGIQTVVSSQIITARIKTGERKILDGIAANFERRNKKQETENKTKSEPVPSTVYFTVSHTNLDLLSGLITQGAIHDKGRTRSRKYYREEGSRGEIMNLDLAVAIYHNAINKNRAVDIFRNELKSIAKGGYVWCQEFDIEQFK